MIKFINEIVPKICTSINCQIFICVLREYETPNYKSHIGDALTPYPSWDWLIRIQITKSFKFYRKSIKSIHWFTKNEMTIYESPEPWCNVLFPIAYSTSLTNLVVQSYDLFANWNWKPPILQEYYTKPL